MSGYAAMTALLQPFGEHIWIADGGEAEVAGFRYPTRMVIIRLVDGGLWLWSPVDHSVALGAAVAALGEVRCLVAPNALHHLYLGAWRQAFPLARLYAAPGLRPRRPDLVFDADLSGAPPPEWADDIDQVLVTGNRITTEAVFHHRASATVIFTDLVQHFRPGWFTGWRALVARLDLMVADEPSVPRKFRLAFTDRQRRPRRPAPHPGLAM